VETRRLGGSGLEVSPIGLGLAALGRPGYINLGHADDVGPDRRPEAMERNAHLVLDAAYDAGVRYFDAARSYGRAESFLASWIRRRGLARGAVTVGSKWGYTYTAEWRVDAPTHEVKDHRLPVFSRQLDESRALLDDHLALYQIHSATIESGVLDDRSVVEALAAARATGLRIGLSVSGPRQADVIYRALDVRRDDERLFDTVQVTWNLLERSAESAIAAAHDAGMGIIVKEVLANGRLTSRGAERREAGAATVARAAERLGVALDALAIAAALAQPWAGVVLSGATTQSQIMSNLAAYRLTVPSDVLAGLQGVAMESAAYWDERGRLAWN
jgi:aryl-alcohol dehydrogenase-like predicted oxidoreductase